MGLHKLSEGSGPVRDVVICYHIDPVRTGPSVVRVCPDAVVLVETFAPGGHYNAGKGITPVADAIAAVRKTEGWELGLLVLVGFSEGCQGVRTALLGGTDPSAVLAVDGIHASDPPNEASQLIPWQAYCHRAKDEARIAVLTHTQIDTTGYLPTKTVVPLVAGLSPIDTAWSWEESEVPGGPHQTARDGFCWVGGWPGKDAAAHVQQQVTVLPWLLEFTLLTAREHRGDLRPTVAPGGGPVPPVLPTPGGGGGRPPAGGGGGGRPPAGGGGKAPPSGGGKAPPASGSSGGGGGLFLAGALFLGGLLAARGRR